MGVDEARAIAVLSVCRSAELPEAGSSRAAALPFVKVSLLISIRDALLSSCGS
jgi:hypothetical protein